MLRSAIDSVDLDQFVETLSEFTVDKHKHKDSIPRLNPDDPMFHWIYRNIDFKKWSNSSEYQVLWLSGPLDRELDQVSSYIVDLEKKTSSRTEQIVLYFLCSSAARKRSAVTFFIYTLLHQILYCSPTQAKKAAIAKTFLHSLREEILENGNFEQYRSNGIPDDKPLKKLLKAPANAPWAALEEVLQGQSFTIIVDGLDDIGDKGFMKEFCEPIRLLRKKKATVKALLTGGPSANIKDLLDGIRYTCIEYDKERKG